MAGANRESASGEYHRSWLLPHPPPSAPSSALTGLRDSIVETDGNGGGSGLPTFSYREASSTASVAVTEALGASVVTGVEFDYHGGNNWCSPGLVQFVERYLLGHGYMALFVSVADVLLNAIVIAVLTKRQMRNPVNTLLTLLACAELALAALYVPFDVIVYAAADHGLPLFVTGSYAAAAYMLFYINAAVLLHMIGTWMIIATALFRYACVQFPVQSAVWCSQRRARLAALLVVGACTAVCVPNMFRNAIIELPRSFFVSPQPPLSDYGHSGGAGNFSSTATAAAASASLAGLSVSGDEWDGQETLVSLASVSLADDILYTINSSAPFYHSEHLSRMNYWLYGLFGKVLPSILLLVLTGLLISLLRVARRRRMRLYCPPQASSVAPPPPKAMNSAVPSGNATPAALRTAAGPPRNAAPLPKIRLLPPTPCDGGSDKEDESSERPFVGGGRATRDRLTSFDAAAASAASAADCRIGERRRGAGGGGGYGREHVRTTRMLLAVVVLFLAVDLPHGYLVIASAVDQCHLEAYNLLGDVIDLATLVAFSVNFALYCAMSKRFRELFTDLLWTAIAAPTLERLAHLRCAAAHALARAAGISGARSEYRSGAGGPASTASYRHRGRRSASNGSKRRQTSPPTTEPVAALASEGLSNVTRSSVRRNCGSGGGGGTRRDRCSIPKRAADAWSGKSSLDSFHLEVEQQHTSCSQLLCSSSSSGSEESLVLPQPPPSCRPATEADRGGGESR